MMTSPSEILRRHRAIERLRSVDPISLHPDVLSLLQEYGRSQDELAGAGQRLTSVNYELREARRDRQRLECILHLVNRRRSIPVSLEFYLSVIDAELLALGRKKGTEADA